MDLEFIQNALTNLADRAEGLAKSLTAVKRDKPLTQDDKSLIRQAVLPNIQESMRMAQVFFIQGDFERMKEAFDEAEHEIAMCH